MKGMNKLMFMQYRSLKFKSLSQGIQCIALRSNCQRKNLTKICKAKTVIIALPNEVYIFVKSIIEVKRK